MQSLVLKLLMVIILYFRTLGRKRETFRSSSMFNKTYGRQLQRQQSINDEEYAIISEIELDSGTSCYKPRLPDRSNSDPTYNKVGHDENIPRADIITLDEYSSPSDVIKDKDVKYDPASEYTTTYDDPVRHNEENIVECKRKSEVKDALEKQELETDKTSPESQDDDAKVSESYESIAGATNSDGKVIADLGKPEIKTHISLLKSTEGEVEECDSAQSRNNCEEDVSVGDSPGYEDTNIIDGNFPAKPKHIFEEHVCLNCLKPEHLERLGIRIITEDKALEDIENESFLDESGDDKSLDNSVDSDGNINSENERECAICKNVYDCLGNVKKQKVTKSSGNVHEYDQLRNYKESVL